MEFLGSQYVRVRGERYCRAASAAGVAISVPSSAPVRCSLFDSPSLRRITVVSSAQPVPEPVSQLDHCVRGLE